MTVKHPIILVLIALTTLCISPVQAREQKFPSWMDDAKLNAERISNTAFGTFNTPIDPETGQIAIDRSQKHKFFKKPKLPDFKKFREKALKAKFENKASGTQSINSKIDFSLKNLSSLKKSESQLDEQIRRAASDIFKQTLNLQKHNLSNKIKALEEIKSLLNTAKVDDPSDLKSSEMRQRISQLSSFIFNLQKVDSKKLTSPTAITKQKVNTISGNIPTRFYRPKPFRSFYKEAKEKKKNE